jgi:hypothetical protein
MKTMNVRCGGSMRRALTVGAAGLLAMLAGEAKGQCVTWYAGPAFSTAHAPSVVSMLPYRGKVAVGGFFVTTLGTNNMELWDGANVSALGNFDSSVDALLTYNINPITHVLVAGGDFNVVDGTAMHQVTIRSDSDVAIGLGWQAMGSGFDGSVRALARYNNVIYAAGNFNNSGSTQTFHIAQWNGSSWQPVGGGLNNIVYALQVYNGSLYAGGGFTTASGGTVSTGGFARWDGTAWHNVGGTFAGTIESLGIYNNALVIGGFFTGFGGSPNLSTYSDTLGYVNIASGGADGSVDSIVVDNGKLFLGGGFFHVGGVAANRVAMFDGTTWNGMLGGTNGGVLAMTAYHNEIVAGGDFTTAGGVTVQDMARYLETGAPWAAVGPVGSTVCPGGSATLSVTPASGYVTSSGFGYHWYHDGTPLSNGVTASGMVVSGALTATLSLSNIQQSDATAYSCLLSNSCGSNQSPSTTLSFCYANCDCSTGSPSLTAADFTCFLSKFRAGDAYANCDGSTGSPALTAADFTCFLTLFRNGCS